MATDQSLKGGPNKVYSVINNFNKGIDRKTADDVAVDSSFRELVNFYNASEGYLSKRPAVYNSNLLDFVKRLVNGAYSDKFSIVNNRFGENKSTVIERLTDFYNTILLCKKKSVKHTSPDETRTFKIDKIVGLQIINNNKFLEALQDYELILNGEYSHKVGSSNIEFGAIIVAGGFSSIDSGGQDTKKLCGFYITRLVIKMTYITGQGYEMSLEIDSVDPTISSSPKRRWLYYPDNYKFSVTLTDEQQYIQNIDEYIPLNSIDIANYNGYSYIPTGKNYLIKIDQNPEKKNVNEKYPKEASLFQIIGGDDKENVYEPTAIELTQIGFNILADDPLKYYKKGSGSTNKIKGVFYSVDMSKNGISFQQPVNTAPYNGTFNIHVVKTGEGELSDPEYRPNNGELDVELNAYKKLPGKWDSSKTVYICDGIDSGQNFELRFKLDTDEFITYISSGSTNVDETGYISDISKLVLSSTRLKVIGNQLVLYGGHGYMFFSEYDVFEYFPNYNYIYIASEIGEESITSINYFRQYYAIFTNKRIKKMVGTFGASDFGIYPLNDFVGCSNGRTVRAIGSNLLFLGNDGIYQLKQGYLGEGTENVEKIDILLGNDLTLNNVIQAFTMNSNYIIVKNDGFTWMVYNTNTMAFYEYNLESFSGQVYNGDSIDIDMKKKALPFYSIFESSVYDANGDFLVVPMYNYKYSDDFKSFENESMELMLFRFSDLEFLDYEDRHKDGEGFISSFETHYMNMGYPTNTKKFKELYIKLKNASGHAIPLYITVWVDDKVVLSPEDYKIVHDEITNTYYYVLLAESNYELNTSKALGEFTLGVDALGEKTIQQIKVKVGEKGRAIKIKLSDGYNDTTELAKEDGNILGLPVRNRNIYDFSISSIGIVYKVKKVKEG